MNNFFAELKRRNVVRVAIAYAVVAWVILQFVDVIADPMSLPEWFQKVTIVFLAIGFPIALLLSWAYEVTPEGVKKTAEVDKSKSLTHGTGQKINKLIGGGLVLALGFIVYQNFFSGSEPTVNEAAAGQASIAVLPFVDLCAAGDQEYFGDGISEEILNVLAKTEGLKVASRTSSFQFKGQNPDIQEIADQLGVETVLEGSIRKDGNTIRITAQLINASDGFHIWSETYERELSSIFAIQDEISENIATALLGTLGLQALPDERFLGTRNAEAYNLYLRGNFLRATRTEDVLVQAVGVYEQALKLDPGYADAWAGLGKAYSLAAVFGGFEPTYATARAFEAVNEALKLDPENGMAYAVLGLLNLQAYNLKAAKINLDKALEHSPEDAEVHFWNGIYYTNIGKFRRAIQFLERGVELDPYITTQRNWLLESYLIVGDVEKAKALFNASTMTSTLDLQFETAQEIEFILAFMAGDLEGVREILSQLDEEEFVGLYLAISLYEGRQDDVKKYEDILRKQLNEGPNDFRRVYSLAYFGDFDEVDRMLFSGSSFATINMREMMIFFSPEVSPRYKVLQVDLRPLLSRHPEIVKGYTEIGIDILKESGLDE